MAEIHTNGQTRIVVLEGDVATKTARNEHGIRANRTEARLSPLYPDRLCPVLSISGDGKVLTMRRARPLSDAEWMLIDPVEFRRIGSARLPIERKRCSFGVVDGRIVAVDYGG